ncbi:MAG: bifunctional nuclease family protein [Treponema sp.]|nr:bifunctional nuclease family protein [Treponema sp.]
MATNTLVEADIWTVAQTDQGNVVLVRPKGSELAVPIFIGQLETQSILIGLGHVEVPRPLTHDLLLSALKTLGADLTRIEINDLREGTFYARLILSRGEETLVVDARPSDAIAAAVRAGCPVFIAEAVVEEAGISVNLVSESSKLGASGSEDEKERLRKELEEAIAEEDYERAALLRDKLKDLEG